MASPATAESSPIRRNFVANAVGSAWSALASFLSIPLYVHFLGVEAYGLVGLFTVLLTLASLFQFGLGPALTRELARLSALRDTVQEMRDLSRTVEVVFWTGAAVAGVALFVAAEWIAGEWLRPDALQQRSVVRSLQLMAVALALQWPGSMYSGGLLGLQRQVLLNAIGIAGITLRTLGSVVVLWQGGSVEAFFTWQIFASALQTALGATGFWRSLPPAAIPARFRVASLRAVRRFAGGIAGISVLSLVLTQMDRIVASRLLGLETLGYYTLAGVAAGALYRAGGPVFGAVYPRLTQLAALGDQASLASLYHRSSQLLATLILPAALLVAAFPGELILLWTQNSDVARHTGPLLRLLVIGTALHALMSMPYALQLAHGWTRLGLCNNAVFAALLLPLLIFAVDRFGAPGAAGVWVTLNAGFLLINVQIMHRRLLPGHLSSWYTRDLGRPFLAALTVIGVARLLVSGIPLAPGLLLLWLAIIWTAGLCAAMLTVPAARRFATRTWRGRPAA